MELIICSNIKENFLCESEKINFSFYKNCENTVKILNISFVRCHFSGVLC